MKSVLVVCLILSLVVVGRSADEEYRGSGSCYLQCLGPCLNSAVNCALCIGRCIINAESSPMGSNHRDTNYFCNLGCSTSVCTKLLTAKNPDEKKMRGCVNSCSQTCTNAEN